MILTVASSDPQLASHGRWGGSLPQRSAAESDLHQQSGSRRSRQHPKSAGGGLMVAQAGSLVTPMRVLLAGNEFQIP